MNAVEHNTRQPLPDEAGEVLRQVREKLAEVGALLDRLSGPAGNRPPAGQDDHADPAVSQPGTATADAPPKPGRLPALGKHDMQAFQLSEFLGRKQADIAATLNAEHGTTYSQGQVSKMIRRARVYMRATGLQPAAPPAAPARSVDPALLDLGRRTDGRRTDGRRSKRGADDA